MINIKYVGLDLHLASISIAVLDSNGKLILQAVIETEANSIREFFKSLNGTVHVAFEEGKLAEWLYCLIRPLVADVIVCNARLIDNSGNKSDRRDARKLAQLLRAGLLKGVFHGQTDMSELKELVRNYNSLVSDSTRVMNRIKAIYQGRAINCCGRAPYSRSQRGLWLSKITHSAAQTRLERLYCQLDHLKQLRQQARKAMLQEAARHPISKVLVKVPGLGPIRVAELMARVVTPHRLRTKRQLWP